MIQLLFVTTTHTETEVARDSAPIAKLKNMALLEVELRGHTKHHKTNSREERTNMEAIPKGARWTVEAIFKGKT